jgi:cytochrome c553
MKTATMLLGLSAVLCAANASALSLYAGQAKAQAMCAQCHGVREPSAGAPFPSLAGRDEAYLQSALKQYRDKTRRSDIMNAVAGSLSDQDIANIAHYYASVKP